MGEEFEAEIGAEDVLSEQAGFAGLGERLFETLIDVEDLAVDVVVAPLAAHRVGGDGHAFDHRMGVVAQDVAVLEGARLALVGVAGEVLGTGEGARHEAPLEAGGEAAPPRPRRPDFLTSAITSSAEIFSLMIFFRAA